MSDKENGMIYSQISQYYNKWSSGNKYYVASGKFYIEEALKHNSTIVELGVGTGRIAGEILKKSMNKVIGVDNCEEMLKQTEKQIKKEYADRLMLLKQDFRELKLPFKCEYIYMPFRTFGHLENNEDRTRTLKAVKKNLLSGGVFIFDHYVLDQGWAQKVSNEQVLMYDDSDIRITDEYSFDFNNKKMHCIVRCNDVIFESFEFYWFDVKSIFKIIKEVGFKVKNLYGDFNRSEYTNKSVNQIWVLEN